MYMADNPPYGATFTYHINDEWTSAKSARQKREKELNKKEENIPFPGWDVLADESNEEGPKLWFTITDDAGQIVDRIKGNYKKGIHRLSWDLSAMPRSAISLDNPDRGGWSSRGMPVVPGKYTVQMSKEHHGVITDLATRQSFEVIPLRSGALPAQSADMIAAYREEVEIMSAALSAVDQSMRLAQDKLSAYKVAAQRTSGDARSVLQQIYDASESISRLQSNLEGNAAKNEIGERNDPNIWSRYSIARRGAGLVYGPTLMHRQNLEMAQKEFGALKADLEQITETVLPSIMTALTTLGAPYIEGQPIPVISVDRN